jgi:hypothetical protein
MDLWQRIVKTDWDIMLCDLCRVPAVYYQRYSGRYLCADHLCSDIEVRAKRVIRQHHWLVRGDRIGVFIGMGNSESLLVFLKSLLKLRTDISVIRLSLPEMYPMTKGQSDWESLSGIAIEAGVTRVALPDAAEDLAVQTLSYLFKGEVDLLLNSDTPGLSLPIMQPFREIPYEELHLYGVHYGVSGIEDGNTDIAQPLDKPLINLLREFSSDHPSAPHALRHYHDNLLLLANQN